MRAKRRSTGSLIFDKRINKWRFLQWVDGKRRSQVIGTKQEFPNKSTAWRAAERLQLSPPQKPVPPEATVNAIAARYLNERLPSRFSTARMYRSWLRNHIQPRWGAVPVNELQPRDIELWLGSLALSPKSKAHIKTMLRILVDYAMWCGSMKIARNPIELVVVRGASKRTRQPRSLTVEEFRKLIAELEEPFKTMARIAVCFGLRVSELLGLRWQDVDWLNGKLCIERAIVMQKLDETKTSASRRHMAIAPELLEVFKVRHSETQFAEPTHWMFASPVKLGRLPISYCHYGRQLQAAASRAGIGNIGTHTMRHTYRSWLDATGAPITVQQRLMRHCDVRTTLNIYGDVVTNEMAEAQGKVVRLAIPTT